MIAFNMTGLMEILEIYQEASEVLCDKVFNIAINLKSDGCQYGLASMVYEFFDKKNSGVSKLCQ